MQNFPYATFASGWYQVAWTSDLPVGHVEPLKYFDTDLVAYRDEFGVVHVSDAFCPHLGAHLGYGGRVEGEGIVCPFHGWKWDGQGRNCDIPYSSIKQMRLTIRQWSVLEQNDVILVWYGASGEEPGPAPQPFVWDDWGPGDYWPVHPTGSRVWRNLRFVPQVVIENGCDAAHFQFVHLASEVPEVASFSDLGDTFEVSIRMKFGGDKKSTWATPQGPIVGSITNRIDGVGLISTQFDVFDRVFNLTATTPIDKDTSDHRSTVWIPRTRLDGSELTEEVRDRWASQQFSQHASDFPIWENMKYVERPPFAREESKAFRSLRDFCRKFYVAEAN